MRKKNIVIAGAGSGMGNHIAEVFGKHGFQVFLLARNRKHLTEYEEQFRDKGIDCFGIVADISEAESVRKAFADIFSEINYIDVLVCNVTIREPGLPTSWTDKDLLEHYNTDVLGAFRCVKEVLPSQIAQGIGTILFTGGGFSIHPMAEYSCVSIDKAALRSLACTLHQELKEKGIFVGIVTIMGNVVPETHYAPEKIAEVYWKMYQERKVWEYIYQ